MIFNIKFWSMEKYLPTKRCRNLRQRYVKNNIDVNIYTVNSPILMRKLISAGVSGVFTDYPDLLQEIINNG